MALMGRVRQATAIMMMGATNTNTNTTSTDVSPAKPGGGDCRLIEITTALRMDSIEDIYSQLFSTWLIEAGIIWLTFQMKAIQYGNQSWGYLIREDHYDHPLCPGFQPGPLSQTPGGLGQRYWSVSEVTWPPKSGVSEVGVFRALQPNDVCFHPGIVQYHTSATVSSTKSPSSGIFKINNKKKFITSLSQCS